MTTINVTLSIENGKQAVFTIKFNVADFDSVIEKVSLVKNYNELTNNKLWQVI